MAAPELSLYVHVPFCLGKCSYCDFYSVTALDASPRVVSRMLEQGAAALERLGGPRLSTVYIGGGTPSVLRAEDLRRLLGGLVSWGSGSAAELSVEANPETVDARFLEDCASAGVTRLSLGVQTLDAGLLALLRRRATPEQTLSALELIRSRWRGALSVDLLAGIPGQTWLRLSADLDAVLAFAPQHVSLYSLTREEGTSYDRMILRGELREMPAAEQDSLWLRGARLLRGRGYAHYEISNFALAGSECLHNLHYWSMDPYLGIGPAAVSTLPGGATGVVRLSEPRSVRGWLAGAGPHVEEVAARDFLFENLMMGLRPARGIAKATIRSRFGGEALRWLLEAWARLSESHGARVRSGRLALTRRGWLLLSGFLTRLLQEMEGMHLDGPPAWPDGGSDRLGTHES